jgi:hypothetical protein
MKKAAATRFLLLAGSAISPLAARRDSGGFGGLSFFSFSKGRLSDNLETA